MNTAEAGILLAKLALYDARRVGREDAEAWARALPDVDLASALAAVDVHVRESTEPMKVAHVLRIVRTGTLAVGVVPSPPSASRLCYEHNREHGTCPDCPGGKDWRPDSAKIDRGDGVPRWRDPRTGDVVLVEPA